MIEKEKWQQLADFHFNDEEFPLPQKTQLYLTGISATAVAFMNETSATKFNASCELPHKETGKTYKAVFTLEEKK